MAKSLYFNTNASSPAVALVKGVSTTSPLGTKPEFVLGDNQDYNIYLVDGAGNYDAASGAAGYTVKFALGDPAGVPTSGTFTLEDSGSAATSALAYNVSAAALQTALNALNTNAGPDSGTVVVTGTWPNYRVTWDTVGARGLLVADSADLVPDSSVVITEETAGDGSTREVQTIEIKRSPFANQYSWGAITNGWNARLNTNTFAFRQALNGADTAQATLELQITDSGGNRYTRVQVPVTIRHQVIDDSALTATTLDTAISSTDADNQFVQNRSSITGLTGGGATNLDGIATANGAATTGWLAAVRNSDTTLNIYRLVSGTDAESSPDVIRPDDYATTTNERVWKLQTISTAGFFTTETVAAFSSAGNSDVTLPANGLQHVAFCEAQAGAGGYTRTLSLLTTNATTGDIIQLRVTVAASTNPTVEVRNASSGGTLLTTFTGDGTAGVIHGTYQYTGSAWVEVGAYWI